MTGTVVTGDPRQSLARAAAEMRAHRVGALMILDDLGALSGILTERDLLHALADGRDPAVTHVSEYMTQEPRTVEAGVHADRAAALMTAHAVRHLPVMEGGKLVGLLSVRDLLAPYARPARIAEPW